MNWGAGPRAWTAAPCSPRRGLRPPGDAASTILGAVLSPLTLANEGRAAPGSRASSLARLHAQPGPLTFLVNLPGPARPTGACERIALWASRPPAHGWRPEGGGAMSAPYPSFREWSGDRDPVGRRGRGRRLMWISSTSSVCAGYALAHSFTASWRSLHGLLMLARGLEPRQGSGWVGACAARCGSRGSCRVRRRSPGRSRRRRRVRR